MERKLLTVCDYLVFGITLAASIVVGLYHAFTGGRQPTLDEYLLGNRKIPCIPVAISLLVTFQSGIGLLGAPVEIYHYGTQIYMGIFGLALGYLLVAIFIVPVFYPLKLTSAYEYLELRFDSRTVRMMGCIMGLLFTCLYMALALFIPALALEAVSGIPKWLSVAMIGSVTTLYTMLGGMKAVVWTDVLQFCIMASGIATLIVMGCSSIGGLDRVWEIAGQRSRLQFFNLDPDPTSRLTFWTMVIGTLFHWLALGISQSGVQRICSTRSVIEAKRAVLFNIPIAIVYETSTALLGLVIFGYYVILQCDPSRAGLISSQNQLVPYFVMDQLAEIPGLPGLFMASLFSATLSTLSSGLSAIAAVMWKDILSPYCACVNRFPASTVTKVIVVAGGVLVIGIAFAAMHMKGTITQITHSALASSSGPLLGVYLLGLTFPWTTATGAIIGCVVSFVLSATLSIGSNIYSLEYPSPPPVPISGCMAFQNITSIPFPWNGTSVSSDNLQNSSSSAQSFVPSIFRVSFMWYHGIGVVCTYILGVVITVISGGCKRTPADPNLVIPALRRLKCYNGHPRLKKEQDILQLKTTESKLPVRLQHFIFKDT